MPGLKQLQKFNSDILSLGNEPSLRAARGEKAVTVPIPKDVKDVDDSDDFVLGLPEIDESKIVKQEVKSESEDFSDIMGTKTPSAAPENVPSAPVPDFSSILNTEPPSSEEEPDLSMFLDEEPKQEEVEEPKEIPVSDLSLEDLLNSEGFDGSFGEQEEAEEVTPEEKIEQPEQSEQPLSEQIQQILEPEKNQKSEENDNLENLEEAPLKQNQTENVLEDFKTELPEFTENDSQSQNDAFSFPSDLGDLSFDQDFPTKDDLDEDFSLPDEATFKNTISDEELNSLADVNFDSEEKKDSPKNENEGETSQDDFDLSELTDDFSVSPSKDDLTGENALPEQKNENLESLDDFNPPSALTDSVSNDIDSLEDLPELDDTDFNLPELDENPSENKKESENQETDYSSQLEPIEVSSGTDFTDSLGSDFTDVKFDDSDIPNFENKNTDTNANGPDFDFSDFEGDFSENNEQKSDSEPSSDEKFETFDTSELDDADFDFPETDSQLSNNSSDASDFALGNADEFDVDNGDFEIPGFSDVETVKENKNGKIKVPGKNDQKTEVKNSLSDEEYKKFLKNLSSYPLNVRIAVEDLIVKDEFTDDAEFEIIQDVLKKVSARQLASKLEKMLDISLPVPRDFERRSAEEYEAYKASFQYQLKNKIIPGAIVACVSCALLYILATFVIYCVYRPIKATNLYSQGYDLLTAKEFPQSEQKFMSARDYKKIKKWYYKFAQGYRNQKQYLRAEKFYKLTLGDFDFDKKAGIDYAEMTLYDQENYPKAEEIVKRLVLDNHINDDDATLLLGDIYLEWATQKDPSKFDEANARYSELIQRNGETDLYMSRKMRYFVRTDNLEQVLIIKPRFMPKEKSLSSADWTELSGYCLDKLYGPLPSQKEYLRSKIEDVKEMLLRAVKTDKQNANGLYNLSRYYIQTKNRTDAKNTLNSAIEAFKIKPVRKQKDIYNEIDSYRLLGEQYSSEKAFLEAEEKYSEGLNIFNFENQNSGLAANEKIGKLYADAGDIDYFVKGNMDFALQNYKDSISSGNDTPSIRYKIGYIQYGKENFSEAIGSFLKASEVYPENQNLLYAMGTTFAQKKDYYASQGAYQTLLEKLDTEKDVRGILFPQKNSTDSNFVDLYMKASNNYGVSLFNVAKRTGKSDLNGKAILNFQNSLRAWDSLSRNQETLVRLPGSNLAEQNIKYALHPVPDFDVALYSELSKTLSDEKGLLQ